MKLERSIDNLAKRLERLDPIPLTPHVPSSNNRTALSHWKGKPVIALEDWIQIRRQLTSRLEYFPDDFDQTLTYMELPYYQYEFESKKRESKDTPFKTKLNHFGRIESICNYIK